MSYKSAEEEKADELREEVKKSIKQAHDGLLDLIKLNSEHDIFKDALVDYWHDSSHELSKMLRKL